MFNGRFDCGYIGYTMAYNKREVQDQNKHMYLDCCADYIKMTNESFYGTAEIPGKVPGDG